MKKIFKGLFIFLFLVLLSGCAKDYKAITSTEFIEKMNLEKGYLVNTHTPIYDSSITKSTSVNGNDIQFLFFEFENAKDAKNYVKKSYKDLGSYKYKDYGSYVVVKNTKGRYFYLIQIDNTVLSGNTDTKSNKKEINRIFKKLGY